MQIHIYEWKHCVAIFGAVYLAYQENNGRVKNQILEIVFDIRRLDSSRLGRLPIY